MICDGCREKEHRLCINFGFFGEEIRRSCFCQHNDKLGEASRGAQAIVAAGKNGPRPSETTSPNRVHPASSTPASTGHERKESGSGGSLRVHSQAGEVSTARVWELPEDLFS